MAFMLPHPGPWLSRQLVDLFGTSRAPARLCAGGVLRRIMHGAYYEVQAWERLSPEEQHLAVLEAYHAFHSRASAAGYLFSHLTAARLHGLHLWEPDSHPQRSIT